MTYLLKIFFDRMRKALGDDCKDVTLSERDDLELSAFSYLLEWTKDEKRFTCKVMFDYHDIEELLYIKRSELISVRGLNVPLVSMEELLMDTLAERFEEKITQSKGELQCRT